MLGHLIWRFRGRVGATVALVIVEAVIMLLLPLFIGIAINGLLDDNRSGVIALGALGVAALVIGSARRFIDTRAYSGMYRHVATEVVATEQAKGTSTSTIAARTTLLTEFIEFLENSMPEVVNTVIGVVGTLVIIASLDMGVFWGCLGLLVLIGVTYWATGGLNYRLNTGYNDELERQVDAIDSRDNERIAGHFGALMRWNRRLSDLETGNYALVWLGIIALIVYTPIAVVTPGETEYGYAFSALIYVFQYVEVLAALPLFIQEIVRLREISTRLPVTTARTGSAEVDA
ncbi:MAG: ABC transporter six-transmembrane domain-containing protein [Actinomycetota bacterium]